MWLAEPRNPDAPLAGLKVVELARVLAGPFCGQILADLEARQAPVTLLIDDLHLLNAAQAWQYLDTLLPELAGTFIAHLVWNHGIQISQVLIIVVRVMHR